MEWLSIAVSILAVLGSLVGWLLSDAKGKGRAEASTKTLDRLEADCRDLPRLRADVDRLERDKASLIAVSALQSAYLEVKQDVRDIKTSLDELIHNQHRGS